MNIVIKLDCELKGVKIESKTIIYNPTYPFTELAGLLKNVELFNIPRRLKSMTLNFGPNHPAAHGILKLVTQVQGEVFQRIDPQFGFLHRGTEKLVENRSYLQALPYFDRFDYVANLFQEHAYCLCVEELAPELKESILSFGLTHVRTLFDELSRLLNHLLTLSATCMDVGSMGPMFWAFEERERLMEFYERLSGARMHTALYKPGNFDWTVLTSAFFLDLARFILRAGRSVNGAVMGLINSKVIKSRLASVGMFSLAKINNYGLTGVLARSGGLRRDQRLRKSSTYGSYWNFSLRSFLGKRGDNLDRFIIRIKESFEIFQFTSQVISFFENFLFTAIRGRASFNSLDMISTKSKFTGMENLITHFKSASEGGAVTSGASYFSVESPKGEVGVMLISSGTPRPYRVKIRTPVSHNMHLIPSACVGFVFSDFVMTFCSLDIVLGEIDR